MGLFSKKPKGMDKYEIESSMDQAKISNKQMFQSDNIDHYLHYRRELDFRMQKLLNYQSKYPSVFKYPHRPSDVANQIKTERAECEQKFMQRNIIRIERILLNYKTERGKKNNFKKETDIIKHYAGEFLPETVEYFIDQLQERFPEYIET